MKEMLTHMGTTHDRRGYSRREFLYGSGVALASMALSRRLVMAKQSETRNSGKKIRMGVVGGGFGAAFQWHEDPNCIVEAVSDLRPDRRENLKTAYRCDKAYNSLEELILDKNVDAVAVFTGAPDHVKHCVKCLKAGKHVICAVPAAMSLDEAHELRETVEKTGLTYMMAETSYYVQSAISARQFYKEGKFGTIFCCEAEYHHPGLDSLMYNADGSRTWRYGFPPMHYPTHSTALLIGVTGERLTEVTCIGWGGEGKIDNDNQYKNPFWNQTAFFKTNKNHACRIAVYWYGAMRGTERAQWYGDKMSFFMYHPNGLGPIIVRAGDQKETDSAGFVRQLSPFEQYEQPEWWKTMLPEPMRHGGGHGGAEPFLTHEFIDALVNERRPAVDVYEALAYTVPGIVAHQSSLKGGEQMKVPGFDRKD